MWKSEVLGTLRMSERGIPGGIGDDALLMGLRGTMGIMGDGALLDGLTGTGAIGLP